MFLFIPRSLCALKRIAAKSEHARYGATTGIRLWSADGIYRAEATDGRRAIVVQGAEPLETPNWPGLKDLPDDAFETILLPKDLERACKVGDEYLQKTFKVVGLATQGKQVFLGLGEDCITARPVEGRFPPIDNVIPKKRPRCSFRIDPKLMAEVLLAMAELLPEGAEGVDLFYYGDGLPVGLCARNAETGALIDALIVPLTTPKEPAPSEPLAIAEEQVPEEGPQEEQAEEGQEAVAQEQPQEQAGGAEEQPAREQPPETGEPTPEEPSQEEPQGPAKEPKRRRKAAKV